MAETLLLNGRLWTQNPDVPQATAVALGGGRILAVGDDADLVDAHRRANTEVIDLRGRRVLPGLIDAHFHFMGWALARRRLRLAGLPSLTAAQDAVAQAAQAVTPGQWLLGQGWNETAWPEQRFLTRYDLDAVAPNHAVFLWRSDLHLAVANSLALQLAGITVATPDPEAGVIDRDHSGEPTGVLRDRAMDLVDKVVPTVLEADVDRAMREAVAEAHRLGLTGVHDFRSEGHARGREAFRAWQRLWSAGDLKLRVWMMIAGEALEDAVALGLQTGFGDDRLRLGGIKLFADGSLGARTAWMLEPYQDSGSEDGDGSGLPIVPMALIADKIARAQAAGISVGIHAIGDRAVRELLDVFSEVVAASPSPISPRWPALRVPHRIEHVQHSNPEDLRRVGELGLVASVQPLHLVDDMGLVERAVGDRARWTYAFRTLLEGGAVLALGSDCPVADPNPFLGIHAAVTRQRRGGLYGDGAPAEGWYPEERLSLVEAVRGYTLGPAYASGQSHTLGSLTPGKLADLVVLDRDIFEIPPSEIADTQVEMTLFDGQIVHGR